MVNDPKEPAGTTGVRSALSEGMRQGRAQAAEQALSRMLAPSLAEAVARLYPDQPEQSDKDGLEPAAAGDGEPKTPKRRTRQGKVTTRGRHRVMGHWEIFDSELNELGGLQQDAIRSFALAGFFGALSLDVLRDVFTSEMSTAEHALWFGLAVASVILAGWNYMNGRHSRKRGKTRLQQIKDEHDEL